MKLVLDTNAYCLCDIRNEKAMELTERAADLFLPIISYGELYYGFKHGKHFEQNMKRLELFLDMYHVKSIFIDKDVAKKFGDIFAHLRKIGKPIPTNDIWIAACCMSVGGTLLTADKHFSYVNQIQSEFLIDL